MFAAAILAFALMVFGSLETSSSSAAADNRYVEQLFSDSVMQIDIQVDSDSWDAMLQDAQAKEYISVDLTIDGVPFSTVGIRTKGNSSLMSGQGTGRYSFKLEFDHYIDGQTCYGLDKFVLNNMQSDNTYMKEYLSYQMMSFIGVPASLCRFASVSVNGEVLGLYLAIEGVEDSYAARNDTGLLYKPESGSLAMGDRGNAEIGGRNPMENGFPGGFAQKGTQEGQSNTTQNAPAPDNSSGQAQANPGALPGGFPSRGTEGAGQGFPAGQDFPNGQIEVPEGGFPSQPDTSTGQQDAAGQQSRPDAPPDSEGGSQNPQDGDAAQENSDPIPNRNNMNFPGNIGGMGGDDASALQYIDDDPASYSSIFDNEVFSGTESDYQRVIAALKALNEGAENLPDYINVEEVLRYFAANTILVNLDSYQGIMLHNYYLAEKDGRLSILPWDFNLSFGGFGITSAEEAVNYPIDSPTTADLSERPLLGKLLEVDEYRELYYEYLDQIISGYFESGLFEVTVTKLDGMISDYVKNDPTAFCTYDEYKSAVEMLKTFGSLRAESVRGQLNGSVPSTTEEQDENPDLLVDASSINLSVLGSQGGGDFGGRIQQGEGGAKGAFAGMSQDRDALRQAMEIISQSETLTEEQKKQLADLGFSENEISSFLEMKNTFVQGMQNAPDAENGMEVPSGLNQDRVGWQRTSSGEPIDSSTVWAICLSGAALLAGIVLAFRLKRNF